MAKINDKLAILLSVATLLFLLGAYITDSYIWGLAWALVGIAAAILVAKVLPKRQKGMGLSQFTATLLLEGKGLSTAYLYRLYPPREQPTGEQTKTANMQEIEAATLNVGESQTVEGAPITTDGNSQSVDEESQPRSPMDVMPVTPQDAYYDREGRYVVNALGYTKAGEEWAAKIYRTLKPNRVYMVVATTDIDRKALATLSLVAKGVKILRPKEMLRRLRQVGVYPTNDRPKERLSAKAYLMGLSYRHAYLFALSAAGCALFSIFLPIKIYYYIFAAINALLAIAVVAVKKLVKE